MKQKDVGKVLRYVAIVGALLVVAATPFAFGAVHAPFYTAAQVMIFLLLVAGATFGALRGQPREERTIAGLFYLAAAFGLLGAFQLVKFPAVLLRLVSPGTLNLVRASMPWASSSEGSTISLLPSGTQLSLFQFLACLSLFILVVTLCRRYGSRIKLAWVLCAIGLLLSLAGLYQRWSGTQEIYGFWDSVHGGAHFGPFVNRNHFAGYLVMVIPVSASLVFIRKLSPTSSKSRGRNHKGTDFSWLQILALCSLVMMLAALFSSQSRGGIIGAGVAACVMSALAWKKAQTRSAGVMCAAIFVVGFLVGIWFAGPELTHRWQDLYRDLSSPMDTGRVRAAKRTLLLFKQFPIFGTGLGTFESVFPSVQTPELGEGIWRYAHNDWLQLLAEAGLVGVVLAGAFGLTLARFMYRRIGSKRMGSGWWLTVGAAGSLCGLVAHGLVDFNFHIPSNSLLASAIVGLGCVSAASLRRQRRRRSHMKRAPVLGTAALMCIGVAMLSASAVAIDLLRADVLVRRPAAGLADAGQLVRAASAWPLDARAPFQLSKLLEAEGRSAESPVSAPQLYEAALQCARLAVRLDPANAQYQESLGWLMVWAGGRPTTENLEAAEAHLRRAVELDPAWPAWAMSIAQFYLQTGRFSGADDYFRRAVEASPQLAKEVIAKLSESGADIHTLRNVLPNQWDPLMELAAHLTATGRAEDALALYTELLEGFPDVPPEKKAPAVLRVAQVGSPALAKEMLERLIRTEGEDLHYLRALAEIARRAGDEELALRTLRKIIELHPASVPDHIAVARELESRGKFPEALPIYLTAYGARPLDGGLCDAVIRCQLALARQDAALETAQNFVLRLPDNARAHYRVGEMLYRVDRLVEAADAYQNAVDLDPDNGTYRAKLQRTLQLLDALRRLKEQAEKG